MAFELKDMSGTLFKNERKEKDSHPDYNGTAKIGGNEFYMNAWIKESKNGKKFFSFSFKVKEAVKVEVKKEEVSDEQLPF